MAELSRFFNSVEGDERTYQANDFAQFFSNFLGNGFFEGLAVSAENTINTIVAPGSAFIEGHEYTNTSSLTLTHAGADASQDRIDRVVLRLDRDIDVRSINAFVKQGTPGSNPEPPALTRNDYIYELSLAQVRIEAGKSYIDSSQITDERGNHEVCGRVQVARQVGDQINTVDIKTVDAPPTEYAEGIAQFYIQGDSQGDNFQKWMESIGVDAERDYGRSNSELRAYVHTISNRQNTGVQEITIFDWSMQRNYRIYGVFRRASNAFGDEIGWREWVEIPVVTERGEEGGAVWKRYSDGWQEIHFQDTEEIESTQSSGPLYFNNRRFDFPRSFAEEPKLAPFCKNVSGTFYVQWGGVRILTSTYVDIYQICTTPDRAGILGYTAVGRWR